MELHQGSLTSPRLVEQIQVEMIQGLSVGQQVDTIFLDIDYTIIEHFSKHLYSSPNKAIEELVVNGFDAGASEVHVFTASDITPNRVIIWDNGVSMNIQGLKDLWRISNSPKKNIPNRIIELANGDHRRMIGKFGIGKIASYTLGNLMSHVCKRGDSYLLVTIDYEQLLEEYDENKASQKTPSADDGSAITEENATNSNGPRPLKAVEIKALTKREADSILSYIFAKKPSCYERMVNEEHWTIAVIDKLKTEAELPPGRLRWVLGNSMPLRPDFRVWVQEKEVEPSLLKKGTAKDVDFSDKEIKEGLLAKWSEANGKTVNGEIRFGKAVGLDKSRPLEAIPYVEFPNLGKAWGQVRQFHKSLIDSSNADEPEEEKRSYGFFLMVLGRLINDRDPKITLRDPSFSTFYRTQYVINVDNLDDVLLADRERLQRNSVLLNELAILQRAIYLTSASWRSAFEKEELRREALNYRLPVLSRDHYLDPLNAFLSHNAPDQLPLFNFYEPSFEAKVLGESRPIASFSTDESKLLVNTSHPYYQNVAALAGGGAKGQRIMRELDLMALSEVVFEGYLLSIGLDRHTVSEIVRWRDDQLRLIAYSDADSFASIVQNFRETANQPDGAAFERALAKLLEAMGFVAEQDGRKNHKDVLMKAPCNNDSYTVSFETKTKKEGKTLANDEAETGGAANHRKKARADHAVIVTREFAGFKKEDYPAILQECAAIGDISIMEVDALIELAVSIKLYHYPLNLIKSIFTTNESPEEKLERIRNLKTPEHSFDFFELIENIWRTHQDIGKGKAISCHYLWQKFYEEQEQPDGSLKKMDEGTFKTYLQALDVLGRPAIQYDYQNNLIAVLQSPEHIKEMLADRLERINSNLIL